MKIKVIPFVLSILGLMAVSFGVGVALESNGISNKEFAFFFGASLMFVIILFFSLQARDKSDFTW